ncbi:unnamed protein product [Owenia fusiformis]|uniref:Uncharacterized protein n=1 Tax=Owenia fusiformis TaxID=6347 RepID=A0A8J1XUX6_OWEFU|nr:unnamed protein product [Owenia fusiformis]
MTDPNESLVRLVLMSVLNLIIHGPQLPDLDGLKSARSEYRRRRFRRYREKVETRTRNLLQFLRQFERLTIGTMYMIDWIITDAFKKVQYKEIKGRGRSIKEKNLKFTDAEWVEKFSNMFKEMNRIINKRFDKKSKTEKNAELKLKIIRSKVKVLGTFMELSGKLLNIPQLVDVGKVCVVNEPQKRPNMDTVINMLDNGYLSIGTKIKHVFKNAFNKMFKRYITLVFS